MEQRGIQLLRRHACRAARLPLLPEAYLLELRHAIDAKEVNAPVTLAEHPLEAPVSCCYWSQVCAALLLGTNSGERAATPLQLSRLPHSYGSYQSYSASSV